MSRNILRTGVAVAAVLAAAAVGTGSAQADTTIPASGSVVLSESHAFLASAAKAGIVATALPPAKVSGTAKKGFSATLPVTGGTGDIPNFFGNISLGGSFVVVDVKTAKTVTFSKLAFSIDNYAITGVKTGTTTPVNLLDVSGDAEASAPGITPETLTSDLIVDVDGAKVLDSALKTKFFVEGQTVGGLSITFTPETTTVS